MIFLSKDRQNLFFEFRYFTLPCLMLTDYIMIIIIIMVSSSKLNLWLHVDILFFF